MHLDLDDLFLGILDSLAGTPFHIIDTAPKDLDHCIVPMLLVQRTPQTTSSLIAASDRLHAIERSIISTLAY